MYKPVPDWILNGTDYPFGIFKLFLFSFFWSLYCLSFFDLRLLITSLVSSNCSCTFSFGHCIAFFLWFTASDYLFGIFKLVLFSFFWSLYCLSFFDLRLLITPLISSSCPCSLFSGHCIAFLSLIYRFWLPLWYLQTVLVLFFLVIVLPFFLWFTASDYPFGIFKLLLFSFFWSLYCLSFSLWFTGSDYLFGILDLRILITPLVS